MLESSSAEGSDRSEEQVSGAKVIAQALKIQVRWIPSGVKVSTEAGGGPRVVIETEGLGGGRRRSCWSFFWTSREDKEAGS